jgi:glycosyltransferase involved in cell wall biosynthesis
MTPNPAVSVVMAVHNGLPYLEDAVRSIMGQTLRAVEIILIDDASTDGTADLLTRLAEEDSRLRVITNRKNLQLAASLNRGIKAARAPLIARMDADDISSPERLGVQKTYMDAHPEVVLVGASIRLIDSQGRSIRKSVRGRDPCATRWLALFDMPLVHPTFMFRSKTQNPQWPRYCARAGYAEDYDFVVRAMQEGDVAALTDILLDYRFHSGSISLRKQAEQRQHARKIALRYQADTLSPELFEALSHFRAAYYDGRQAQPAGVFSGMQQLLATDAARCPSHRKWMERQAAWLAYTALKHSGIPRGSIVRAFLASGRRFIWPVLAQYLEQRSLLPRVRREDFPRL